MAAGTIKWFAQGLHDLGKKIHNLQSDTLKLGIITSSGTPGIATVEPHFGGTGTTNLATNEVDTGTSYVAGGPTLASVTWTVVAGVPTLRAQILVIAQDASGFTNGRWGIVYNSTDANKRALGYVEFETDRSIVGGSLTLDWNGANNDVLTITQS
jgi:hypothetical protein